MLNAADPAPGLADVMVMKGVPEHIRSDNGPELVTGAKTLYMKPGSPWENGDCGSQEDPDESKPHQNATAAVCGSHRLKVPCAKLYGTQARSRPVRSSKLAQRHRLLC